MKSPGLSQSKMFSHKIMPNGRGYFDSNLSHKYNIPRLARDVSVCLPSGVIFFLYYCHLVINFFANNYFILCIFFIIIKPRDETFFHLILIIITH